MVLITGGTGFIGRAVVRQLVQAGHRVRLLVRRPGRAARLVEEYGCEVVSGDVLDPASLSRAMVGVDAVVHLVGIIHETPRVTFESAHTQATANVIAAARGAGVRRYLHMSALGTRAHAVSRYHRTKWESEELVRQSGLDWTILRPSMVYGSGDRSLNVLAAFIRPPLDFWNFYTFPNLGGGESRLQPVAVDEVALAFVRALSNSLSLGKTYDVCGPEPIQWKELLLLLAQRQGVKAVLDASAKWFVLRSILWSALMAIPIFAAIFYAFGLLPIEAIVILVAVEAGLLQLARAWKTFHFYTVPWRYLRAAAWLAKKILPRWLHIGEQLALLQEDNVGDPLPVQRDLHLRFQSITERWHYPW